MNVSMPFADRVRPAGIRGDSRAESAADSLRSGWGENDGNRCQPSEFRDQIHGKPTVKSESVARCFKSQRKTTLESFLADRAEQIYWSRKHEPIGRGLVRGYTLPPACHMYGKPCERGLQVGDILSEASDTNSCTGLDVGKQCSRDYIWPSQVDAGFTFGQKEHRHGSAAEALDWTTPETVLEPSRVADFKAALNAPVGSRGQTKQGEIPVHSEFRFGSKITKSDDTAAACIQQNFNCLNELLPDASIGKSVKRGGTAVSMV